MPLQPNGEKLHMPIETVADVRAFFAEAVSLSRQKLGPLSRTHYIADYFFYIGAVHPDYFQPFQEKMVSLPFSTGSRNQ